MQQRFYQLADSLQETLTGSERFIMNYSSEDSNFIRFNKGKVRQPGTIRQEYVNLRLLNGNRHASQTIPLVGDQQIDTKSLKAGILKLRDLLPHLPEDPHLLVNEEIQSNEKILENTLAPAEDMVDQIISTSEGLDLVGILASGGIHRGFANSMGQRNWFSTHNFNYDWSLVLDKDKAVKSTYAGTAWDGVVFNEKMNLAKRKLKALNQPAKTLSPGEYRVYLTPEALWEILEILGWGGFSVRSQESKVSPLIKLVAGEESLNPGFSLFEHVAGGSSPGFQEDGFTRPDRICLIEDGNFSDPLISPRSAKEYNKTTNGASSAEHPDSLDVSPGSLDENKIIETLGDGIHIGNLWYLNFSDRRTCRITGMTRFATFWVEGGEVAGPLNVMRFDDSLYRMLGSNLLGLTRQRSFLLSASSYFHRSTSSAHLPGAVIKDFRFTL